MFNDIISKCRTCLNEATSYKTFEDTEEDCTILEMLDSLVPQINIKNNWRFSLLICETCVGKLVTGYKFQQLCIKSNTSLLDLLGVLGLESNDPLKEDISLNTEEVKGDTYNEIDSLSENLNYLLESENSGFVDENSCPSFRQTKSRVININHHSAKKVGDVKHKEHRKCEDLHCIYCLKSFNSKLPGKSQKGIENLPNRHKRRQTNDEKSPSYNFNNDQLAKEPVETSFGKSENLNRVSKKYTCKVCGKVFDRPCNLQRHGSVHSLARPHECKFCKYRFANVKILKAHLFQHRKETVESIPEACKCDICQKSFMSMKQLVRHYKNQHPAATKYNCEHCSKAFILQESLSDHIKYSHQSHGNLKCQMCEKVFGNSIKLKQHMRIHNSYLCPHCGKTFRGPSNLRQHMERHIGLQKYQCPDCPKRFNCKSDVLKHASAHLDAKPFVCDICGSRFTRKYSMQKHKSLHTAERSYKCDQCNMSFKLVSLLKRHIRTHTGEKPYKCKFCDRAYSESGDLTKHLRTHVGENTYMCDQCPKAFKYQAELRQHQSQHYKMEKRLSQAEERLLEETKHKNANDSY